MLGPAPAPAAATVLLRLLVALLAAAALGRRGRVAGGLVVAALGAFAGALWQWARSPGWLLDAPGVLLRVGRLELSLALVLDGAALVLLVPLLLGCLVAAWRGSAAQRGALAAAVWLVLADDLVVTLGAWEWLALASLAWAAQRGAEVRGAAVLDRAGALLLGLWALLLFFGLGGSWSAAGRGYLVDVPGGEFATLSAWQPATGGLTALASGPTTSLHHITSLLQLREEASQGAARPLRALLDDKLLLGAPLRVGLLGLLGLGLGLRGLAPLWGGRAWAAGLSMSAALSLLWRARGLWLVLVLAGALAGCQPAGPRLEAEGLKLPAEGGSGVVMLRNRGSAPLHIERVTLSGDSAGFAVTSPPAQTLAPGEALPLTVSFQADGRRTQALGALQVLCDDPRGKDEARTPERESLIGVPLSAGTSPRLLLLPLLPLLGALAGAGRRRWPRLAWGGALVGALLPVGVVAWAAIGLRAEAGMAEGNYGLQWLYHRTLLHTPPLELHVGFNGAALLLLPLALGPALQVVQRFGARPPVEELAGLTRLLVLEAGLFLWVIALDLGLLLLTGLLLLALAGRGRAGGRCARGLQCWRGWPRWPCGTPRCRRSLSTAHRWRTPRIWRG